VAFELWLAIHPSETLLVLWSVTNDSPFRPPVA
jgi:hypothetical protein